MQPTLFPIVAIAFSISLLSLRADEQGTVASGIARLAAELDKGPFQPTDWTRRGHFEILWRQTCARAGSGEADALGVLFFKIPEDFQGRTSLFVAYSNLRIAREIETIAMENPTAPDFGPHQEPIPQGLPAELGDAWTEFHRVTTKTATLFGKRGEGRNFHGNRAEFFQLLDAFLREPTSELAGKINEFSPYVGKGGHEVDIAETQQRVRLMDLLRRRQLHEALGIVFGLKDLERQASETNNRFARSLAKSCGHDWETLFLGAIAHGGDPYSCWGIAREGRVKELLAHGSDASLRLLVKFEKANLGTNRETLQTLIPPDHGGVKIPLMYTAQRTHAAPEDVQKELIEIALQWFTQLRSRRNLNELRILGSLRRSEFAESWQALAWHISEPVATLARGMLREMDIEPRPPELAKIHVTKNGEPVANTELFFDFFQEDKRPDFDLDERRQARGTTDKNGDIEIWKTIMTTGDRLPTTIRVFKPGTVSVSTNRDAAASYWASNWWYPKIQERAWVLRIPVPGDLGTPINVNVRTYDASFHVVANFDRVVGKTATIVLSSDSEGPLSGVFKVPAGEVITITDLLEGNYKATINVPGIAEWRGGPFRVEPDAKPILVRPERGSDLRVTVVPPGADRATIAYSLIRKNGPKDWLPNSECQGGVRTFHGLEKGDYVLRIPPPDEWPFDVPKSVPNYRARNIRFQITSKTPPVLDLGQIQIKATK